MSREPIRRACKATGRDTVDLTLFPSTLSPGDKLGDKPASKRRLPDPTHRSHFPLRRVYSRCTFAHFLARVAPDKREVRGSTPRRPTPGNEGGATIYVAPPSRFSGTAPRVKHTLCSATRDMGRDMGDRLGPTPIIGFSRNPRGPGSAEQPTPRLSSHLGHDEADGGQHVVLAGAARGEFQCVVTAGVESVAHVGHGRPSECARSAQPPSCDCRRSRRCSRWTAARSPRSGRQRV